MFFFFTLSRWCLVDRAVFETAHQIVQRHNVSGKTYLVTGGSSGIGFETARVLVQGGAHVVVASRSVERGQRAVGRMNDDQGNGRASFELLDLSSFASVDALINTLHSKQTTFDGIVLNAGLIVPSHGLTEDGLERTLQVNHLSHLYLSSELVQRNILKADAPSHIVILSSYLPAKYSSDSLFHIAEAKNFPFFLPGVYGIAKQASVRTGRVLEQKYVDKNIKVYSVHPGFACTSLGIKRGGFILEKIGSQLFWWVMSHFVRVKTMEEAASTSIYCLLEQGLQKGFYQDNQHTRWPKAMDNVGDEQHPEQHRQTQDQACWDKSMQLIQEARQGKWKGHTEHNTTAQEGGWLNGPLMATLGTVAGHLLIYYAVFSLLTSLDYEALPGVGAKINPHASDNKIVAREKQRVFYSCVIDAGYAAGIGQYATFSCLSKTSWFGIAGWILLVVFWTDFHFYATHRFLHSNQWIYRWVHYAHHESHNPNVWRYESENGVCGRQIF
jgi:NAD(P)-dependent dehydrogenase (short-subunit alcohol dehydrogenase family)